MRQYNRLEREIIFQVEGQDKKGQPFLENRSALNLSGGGALFVTTSVHLYFIEQTLDIRVILPGTSDVNGVMTSTARVVRVSKELKGEKSSDEKNYRIAICFQKHLELLRTDR